MISYWRKNANILTCGGHSTSVSSLSDLDVETPSTPEAVADKVESQQVAASWEFQHACERKAEIHLSQFWTYFTWNM